MALPIIAAGIAARAVAKKLATRAVGGITGAGAKNVAPVYRNMQTGNVKILPNSAIGLVIKDNVITKNAKQQTFKKLVNPPIAVPISKILFGLISLIKS